MSANAAFDAVACSGDAGWSHQEVTLLTGAVTILLALLGTVSL